MAAPAGGIAALLCLAGSLALAAPAPLRDALGRTVSLPAPPRRIVSLAPEVTETLFALGLGDRVVGVTQYCNYPPQVARLPKIGGFTNPSMERILSLRPDLVVGSRGNPRQVWQALERARVPAFAIDPATVAQVLTAISQLGALTWRQAQAAALVSSLQRQLQAVDRAVAGLPRRPRLLIVYSLAPLWVAGRDTFPDDILRRAGAANSAAALRGYAQWSMERALAARPQGMLVVPMVGQTPDQAVRQLRRAPAFADLPCVRAGHVYSLDPDLLNRAGPRIGEAVAALHRLVALLARGK